MWGIHRSIIIIVVVMVAAWNTHKMSKYINKILSIIEFINGRWPTSTLQIVYILFFCIVFCFEKKFEWNRSIEVIIVVFVWFSSHVICSFCRWQKNPFNKLHLVLGDWLNAHNLILVANTVLHQWIKYIEVLVSVTSCKSYNSSNQ